MDKTVDRACARRKVMASVSSRRCPPGTYGADTRGPARRSVATSVEVGVGPPPLVVSGTGLKVESDMIEPPDGKWVVVIV